MITAGVAVHLHSGLNHTPAEVQVSLSTSSGEACADWWILVQSFKAYYCRSCCTLVQWPLWYTCKGAGVTEYIFLRSLHWLMDSRPILDSLSMQELLVFCDSVLRPCNQGWLTIGNSGGSQSLWKAGERLCKSFSWEHLWFLDQQLWAKIHVNQKRLDGVAPLVADPPRWNSTTRPNPSICNIPLYIAVPF